MRNLIAIAILVLVASCKQEPQIPKDYAVVHGTIKNVKDSINFRLYNPETSKSFVIEVDESGNFRDTLKLESPAMFNAVYNNIFVLYLQNDMDLKIDFDSDKIKETLTFQGNGEEENNFLKFKSKHVSGLFGDDYKAYLGLNEDDFNKTTDKFLDDFHSELDKKAAVLDSVFVAKEKADMAEFKKSMIAQHQEQLEINAKLGKGKPSPDFKDYINYNGGTSSLADFRGSYVYIDVWATWCIPCIYEIPFLKKVEKEYADKNIKFMSISADQPKDEQKWRDMIKDKDLHGIQLLADNAIESQFLMDYYIYGIPRFILLDPQGNIVSYDAPRPSEDRLKELFNSLNI
ncbi:TlpA family protein disulfide reductase [Gelidibacter maritimus]|uniref:TlpA family protein disulfide reductase n=1 Tax=Gelidibacter maritimus TaxID=2761487 RepID=A0A7W2R2Q8_9FLAO|nr:TlpA disulfide reductase family protein [Gelidibacter maritimus]MBA6152054.1 TlpA family protein disulfide reductase [Gelidibacter maritimus]